MLSVEFFIATRYLNSRNKSFASKLIIFLAVCSVTVGVSILIISLSVLNGFKLDLYNKILEKQPHLNITKPCASFNEYQIVKKKIQQHKSVINVVPCIYKQVFISDSKLINMSLITIRASNNLSKLNSSVQHNDLPDMIIGSALAKRLSVKIGDIVKIIIIDDNILKIFYFNVIDIQSSGIYSLDSFLVEINLATAQNIFEMKHEITGFDIYIKNASKANTVKQNLDKILSSMYIITTWIETNKQLFSALAIEKIMMIIIVGCIILIASLNIMSNIILSSIQKTKDIGIMYSFGFSRLSIAKIFFFEGIILGTIGLLIGILTGILISLLLKHVKIFNLPYDIYLTNKLPICIIPIDIITITISTLMIITITGICPAYYVTKLDPMQAIKNG
ncbi:MAG: FtsX-like permease family protein [Endomicrobium sp.]|jgi:lipoprotein-releasing system permease protein|nr:FtsX-like permease family protein [Endomicrobium sp.]